MFQFATFASHTYVFSVRWPYGRVSPFGNLRIKVCLLTPRSLSQATTSFIACNRQGIHHVHLFTCPYNVDLWFRVHEIKDAIEYFEYSVCRIQRLFAFLIRELFTYIFDWYNQHPPVVSNTLITNVYLQLINLYFFQIVKELNSHWSLKDQT